MTKEQKDKIIRFILKHKFQLKFNGISEKKWRRKIAESYLLQKVGTSDDFVECWTYLEKQNLI